MTIGTAAWAAIALIGLTPLAGSAVKAQRLLDPATLDPVLLLPPPPARGSAAERVELDVVRAAVSRASAAELARARYDDAHEDAAIFDTTIAPGFSLSSHPATWALLTQVAAEADADVSLAKRHFARMRPWGVDPALRHCDAAPGKRAVLSYPSGHAIIGYSTGMMLAALVPEKASAILARARDYAYERVVCGVHFPSDIEASHALAAILVTRLEALPAIRDRMDAARVEMRAALASLVPPKGRG